MTHTGELSRLLEEASRGDRGAADRLVPILYDELRRMAHRRMRGERSGHTLDTTALVHEAYLELAGLDRMEWRSRAHFLAVAAIAMRRVRFARPSSISRAAEARSCSPVTSWSSSSACAIT